MGLKEEEHLAKAVEAGIKAVENQSKMAEAAMIAAKAFDRLVTLIENCAEKAMAKRD
jgi:hypothetical protein